VVLGFETGGVLEDAAAAQPIPLEDRISLLRGLLGGDPATE
jgi:hypothetical protein